jgi:hypothetical protein
MEKRTVRFEPGKKISETFLEFAAPLLADLPSEDREIKARYALIMAFTAWNAVIFADVLNDSRYVDQIRGLAQYRPEARQLIDAMIARKRALFAEDDRMIGTWEVTRTEDGINLRADARDPYSLPRNAS